MADQQEEEYYYYEEDEQVNYIVQYWQDWILDSISEYLKSPVWKNPILEFIDQNCLVFDEEDENKLEYTLIHKEFKALVENKLEQFVADLGIPFELFINACEVASQKIHKSIVNQLQAVDNFLLFKKMMIARIKQLNHEAQKEIPKQGNQSSEEEDQEEKAAREKEEAELQQAIAESQALEVILVFDKTFQEKRQAWLLQQEQQEQIIIQQQLQVKQQNHVKEEQQNNQNNDLPQLPSISGKQKVQATFDEINIEEEKSDKNKKEQDLHERKERLKLQRDLLLKKKAEERQNEIQSYQEQKQSSQNNEEEEKNQRIKKGMAALSQNKKNDKDIQKKRINFMAEIRDALIAGEGTTEGEPKVKKIKKKKVQNNNEFL